MAKRIGIKRRKCRGEQIFLSMHMEENWQKRQQKDCGGFLLIWRIRPLYPEQKETAQIVLQGRKIPLIEEPQIQEICFGDYEGIVYRGEGLDPQSAEFVKFFDDTANYIPKGEGESVGQLMERVDGFLKALYQNPELQDKMIFAFYAWCCSHGNEKLHQK